MSTRTRGARPTSRAGRKQASKKPSAVPVERPAAGRLQDRPGDEL